MAEHYDDLLRVAGSLVETAGVRPWCNALIYPELEPGDKVPPPCRSRGACPHADEAREAEAAFAELGVLPN